MGCANSKTGATAVAEEGAVEGAPPKVAENEEGAANGNAVACSNGSDENAGEKEACNGDVKSSDEAAAATEATPAGEKEKSEEGQNGGEEASIQDGGDGAAKEEGENASAESREEEEAEKADE